MWEERQSWEYPLFCNRAQWLLDEGHCWWFQQRNVLFYQESSVPDLRTWRWSLSEHLSLRSNRHQVCQAHFLPCYNFQSWNWSDVWCRHDPVYWAQPKRSWGGSYYNIQSRESWILQLCALTHGCRKSNGLSGFIRCWLWYQGIEVGSWWRLGIQPIVP